MNKMNAVCQECEVSENEQDGDGGRCPKKMRRSGTHVQRANWQSYFEKISVDTARGRKDDKSKGQWWQVVLKKKQEKERDRDARVDLINMS